MKFEKQMKKHIDQVFEENVPNPYPTPIKQSRFPSWFKFAVPAGAVLAAASVATAIIVPNAIGNALGPIGSGNGSSSNDPARSEAPSTSVPFSGTDCTEMTNFVIAPKNDRSVPPLDTKIVSRTGLKSLEKLIPFFQDPSNENFVLSPASHLLCASSLMAVSDGFDLDAFGLVDAGDDTKTFLEQWNCSYGQTNRTTGEYVESVRFDSAVLHQQVGGRFAFDPAKCKAVEDNYIATSAAKHSNYVQQAQNYFEQAIGLEIAVPQVPMNGDGVLTYAALRMKDLAMGTYTTEKRSFHTKNGTIQVDYGLFGKANAGVSVRYFDGDNYFAFAFRNSTTEMMIVLPDEGVPLEAVSLGEAYSEITKRSPQRRPADQERGGEGGEGIDDERRSEERPEKQGRAPAEEHADYVDQHDGNGRHLAVHAAAQAKQDDEKHRQQGQHHLVRQARQPAAQGDRGVQYRKSENNPELF